MKKIKSIIKNKKIFCLLFILNYIQLIGQDTKSISFIKNGSIEKISLRGLGTELENDSVKIKSKYKTEYFFNQDGYITKMTDSLSNTTIYYYYTKNNFCEKKITKTENIIKYIELLEKTDSCIISKAFDSQLVLLSTSEIKVNDSDNIIYKKTTSESGYTEILTSEYDKNLLRIKSTYWSEGMDFSSDIHYENEIRDKYGNWTKCISSIDIPFKDRTVMIREIIYR